MRITRTLPSPLCRPCTYKMAAARAMAVFESVVRWSTGQGPPTGTGHQARPVQVVSQGVVFDVGKPVSQGIENSICTRSWFSGVTVVR